MATPHHRAHGRWPADGGSAAWDVDLAVGPECRITGLGACLPRLLLPPLARS